MWVVTAKLEAEDQNHVKERKYFAKQIVSVRFCGEIKTGLRYSSGGKRDVSCHKVVRIVNRLIMRENEQSAAR